MIEAASAEIIEKQIALARRGHAGVARFLLERIVPIAKSSPIEGSLNLKGSPADQARAVLVALAAAEISHDDATTLLHAIRSVQEISDATEIKDRLEEIEKTLAALTAATSGKPSVDGGEDAS
jgi:hypothetical protein